MTRGRNRKRVAHADMVPVKDLDQANVTLGEIARLKRRLNEIENGMNEEIDAVKARAEREAEPLLKRLKALENGLLAFAEFNRDELFQKRKSVELTYGMIGYRKSTQVKTMPKVKWADVIEKLEELGLTEAIRIKKSPDKDVMRGWSDERLALVGARKVSQDTFWYETKEEEVSATRG